VSRLRGVGVRVALHQREGPWITKLWPVPSLVCVGVGGG